MATKWDKDLAKIDKQIAELSDDDLLAHRQPPPQPAGGGAAPTPQPPPAPAAPRRSRWGVLLRAGLTLALAAAVTLWPYGARCGVPLFAYLASLTVLLITGAWAAVWSWRHRAAAAHVLSLLSMLWALALGAREVLPRAGYALPAPSHPAIWMCQ